MGDALICNGLVRTLVERGHEVTLPCYRRNIESVTVMFADLPEVIVVDHADMLLKSDYFTPLYLGHYAVEAGTDTFDESRFDAEFYRQAGVPFLHKWEKFRLPSLPKFPAAPVPFVHDDPSRGFNIPVEGYRPLHKGTIFDNMHELLAATEVHCIDSCFSALADLLRLTVPLFLYQSLRPGATQIYGQHWIRK